MNYLAHIYLSGQNDERMIGNFIADFVKGKKKDDFPEQIKKGIELHRSIDDFTDHHPVTAKSKTRLYSRQHKYSSVVVDLYYDHFLAKNFSDYSDVRLDKFADETYKTIQTYYEYLPDPVRAFLPYMIERNWLLNYATVEGIGRTLTGLGKRVSFPNKMNEAASDLELNYDEYEAEFTDFFPELIKFVSEVKL